MRVMTAARYSRADKHGNGGGKLLSATMRDIPDAAMDYAIADVMLTMQTTDEGREAVKAAARECLHVEL